MAVLTRASLRALIERYLSFGLEGMGSDDRMMIRRARAFGLVMLVFLPLCAISTGFVTHDWRNPAAFVAGTAALVLMIRYGHLGGARLIRLSIHANIASMLGATTVLALEIGNGNALSVTYPAVLIVATCYLLGTRATIFWTVASIVCLGWVMSHSPVLEAPDGTITASARDVFFSRALVLTLLCAFAVVERRFSDGARRELQYLARHDSLTGLLNRRALEERLATTLARCRRYERRFALLFIDLDGFKRINDRHGHVGGDEFLRTLAARVASITRTSDTVARMGGDEFTVILEEYPDEKSVELYAERLRALLAEAVELEGQAFSPSASIGIALYPSDAEDASGLLRAADLAMYDAKAGGGGRVRKFADVREIEAIPKTGL